MVIKRNGGRLVGNVAGLHPFSLRGMEIHRVDHLFLRNPSEIPDLMLQTVPLLLHPVIFFYDFLDPFTHLLPSNPRSDSFDQTGLPHIFLLQSLHHIFVMGILGDDMMDHHRVFLSLSPQSGVQLLV